MFEFFFTHPLWAYRAGTITLASPWPKWLLLLFVIAACALIGITLWRRRFLGLPRLLLLGALQAALAILVLCLLWRPVLNVERVRDRQNVLAIVLDNSSSMVQADGEATKDSAAPTRSQQAIAALKDGPLAELAKTFELRFFAFGNQTTPLTSLDNLPEPGSQTRIGDALLNVLQTAGSVPMAGVLLVSDGAETNRSLSEANISSIVSYGVPIHTIGVGPEHIDNDLELESIDVPTSSAPGSTVTASFSVRHSGAGNTRLRVYDHDTLLAARELKLTAKGANDQGYITTDRIEFPAGEAGVRDLRFTLDPLPNERNTINNSRHQVLNVPAIRRNILYVEGEPRWEFKFIRRAIESERSLRLASIVRTTQNKFYRQGINSAAELSDGFPTTAKELFAYDAVIIGSYEAASLSVAQQELLKEFVDRRGGTLLLLAARNGLGDGGWGSSAVQQVLPTHLPKKRGSDFVQLETKALLTDYGAEATMLRFDADPAKNAEQWQSLPDLANYQAMGPLKPGAVVLLDAMIKREREPLLVYQRFGRGAAYEFATASTQRWQTSLPPADQRHEIFWRQLMHALADEAPQRASLSSDRMVYEDERSVRIEAEIRDEKFELLHAAEDRSQVDRNGADRNAPNRSNVPPTKPKTQTASSKAKAESQVELLITPEQGKPYVLPMQASTTDEGRFSAELNAEADGLYKIELTARAGKDDVLNVDNAFRREDNVIEHFAAFQHRAVLERLSSQSSGQYWRLDQLQNLSKAIPYTKSGIVERQMLDLWSLPIVFLTLLFLKAGEWLLRLKWGTL